MVQWQELQSRIQMFLKFSQQELTGLLPAIIITAFIFSFRDWGEEQFQAILGVKHLVIAVLITALTFFFRLTCQKIYGLNEGYKVEFKVWWMGIAIGLVVAFITLGRIPLVLIGTVVASFMVKQRLGEFRYGFSYWHNAMIAYWGILGNLILGLLFAIGSYFFPQSYFFSKGLLLNIIMAFCSLLPLPQLDGLAIFFGSRTLYFLGIALTILGAVLLITKTKVGLITAVVLAILYAGIYLLIGSEK